MDDDGISAAVAQLGQMLEAAGRILSWRYHNAQVIFIVPDDLPSPVVVRKAMRPGSEDQHPVYGPQAAPVEIEFVAVVSAKRKIKANSFAELGDALVAEGYRMAEAMRDGEGLTVPHPKRDPAVIKTEVSS